MNIGVEPLVGTAFRVTVVVVVPITGLPLASWTVKTGVVAKTPREATFDGFVVKATLAGSAAATVKLFDRAAVTTVVSEVESDTELNLSLKVPAGS